MMDCGNEDSSGMLQPRIKVSEFLRIFYVVRETATLLPGHGQYVASSPGAPGVPGGPME